MPRKKKSKRSGDKVHLHVVISREIYDLLVKMAPEIYGEGVYRGALSHVVEEALKHYLLPRARTQIRTNPTHKVREVYEQVVEKIKEIMNFPLKPKEVSERILDLAISDVRGSDPRTIEKWKRIFEKMGLIKFAGGVKPNRVVELL